MSYCRFGFDSDVYVFESDRGYECCGCILKGESWLDGWNSVRTLGEMIEHLMLHKTKGHMVPDDVIETMREEICSTDNTK